MAVKRVCQEKIAMNPPYVVDSIKIKQLREDLGLTQAGLAKKARISQASVSKAEKYGRSSRQVAEKLAGCLGVRLKDLRPPSAPPLLPSHHEDRTPTEGPGRTDYLERLDQDQREAKGAGRRKDDNVPLIQLMAALRRITAGEDWAKRSALTQILLCFDPEIRDRWPELQDAEVDALRQLLAMHDAERQQE